VSLAALALYDGGADVSADNISLLLKESNNEVAPYWPGLFASFLNGRMDTLVFTIGGGAAPSGGAAAAAAPVAAAEAPKEEKKKEEVVDALDGGMDLFGGGGGGGGDY